MHLFPPLRHHLDPFLMSEGYSCLTIATSSRWVDLLTDALAELGTLGLQVNDGDPITIVAYFEGGDNLDVVERVIRSRLDDRCIQKGTVTIAHGTVPPTDWETQWRQTLSPVRIGRRWLVRPSWHSSDAFDRETLIIDPKMAFGTGTHATTHLCLVELENLVSPGMSVLDLGTGTAILAIASVKMGARPVVAVEIDPVAVECARENLVLNHADESVRLITGTLDDVEPGRFDVVMANIEYRTLVVVASDIRERLHPGGVAVFSGILDMEADAFAERLRSAGLRVLRMRHRYDPTTDDRWVSFAASSA